MLTTRLRFTKNQKGMTLIELLAVVVILGILAAVAATAVLGGFDKAETSADEASTRIITDAVQRFYMDERSSIIFTDKSYTVKIEDDLVDNGYLVKVPEKANGGSFTVTISDTGKITVN